MFLKRTISIVSIIMFLFVLYFSILEIFSDNRIDEEIIVLEQIVNGIPLEVKIGQMLVVGFCGTKIEDEGVKRLKRHIGKGEISGIILNKDNIIDREQLEKLIKGLKRIEYPYPLIISLDQEGGHVQRLNGKNGYKDFPSHKRVAETGSLKEASNIYLDLAGVVKDAGFNMNFSPVVDIDINPESPVIGKIERSFSRNPQIVYMYALQVIKAHKQKGVISVIKHYPGHGSANVDSHKETTDISDTWTAYELFPYRKLINQRKVDAIMTAHVYNSYIDNQYPATLSKKHIQTNLRKNLNYNGVIITDDLRMGAITNRYKFEEVVINAINAGNDILLFADYSEIDRETPSRVRDIVCRAIEEKKIRQERIDESFIRIMRLKRLL